jgi:hypothetical protein
MSITLTELIIVWEGKRGRRAEKCKLETNDSDRSNSIRKRDK